MLALLLAAAALGASNFAAAIGIGLGGTGHRDRLRLAAVFGFFEVAMPLIGLACGRAVTASLGGTMDQLGGGLLIALGCYEAAAGWRGNDHDVASTHRALGPLILSGLALSIDNLVVGFALGSLQVSFVVAALTIGAVSVALSLVGLELGTRLGSEIEHRSQAAGGVVLIMVGVALASGVL